MMAERGDKGIIEMATSRMEEMQTENKLMKRDITDKD